MLEKTLKSYNIQVMQVFRPGSYKYLLCLPPSLLGRHRHTLADFGQTQLFYNPVFDCFEFSLVMLIFGLIQFLG